MTVTDTTERIALLKNIAADLQAARVIAELSLQADDVFATSVELAA